MADAQEYHYGAATIYEVVARVPAGETGGTFSITEKFFESNNPDYDAILLLGCRVNHKNTSQNVLNTLPWRGFSKRGRGLSRLFIKDIYCTYSIPSFETLQTLDYTSRYATVGTVDHGGDYSPDLSSEGVLAEFVEHTGYDLKYFSPTLESSSGNFTAQETGGYRVWTHQIRSPMHYHYEDIETTLPLIFTVRSVGFDAAKPCHVFWRIIAGIRFMASEKSAKHVKKIELGGVV